MFLFKVSVTHTWIVPNPQKIFAWLGNGTSTDSVRSTGTTKNVLWLEQVELTWIAVGHPADPSNLYLRRLHVAKLYSQQHPSAAHAIEELGVSGMSSDDSDHESGRGAARYTIYCNNWNATSGAWPHLQLISHKSSTWAAVKGLPRNFYARRFLVSLTQEAFDELQSIEQTLPLGIPDGLRELAKPYDIFNWRIISGHANISGSAGKETTVAQADCGDRVPLTKQTTKKTTSGIAPQVWLILGPPASTSGKASKGISRTTAHSSKTTRGASPETTSSLSSLTTVPSSLARDTILVHFGTIPSVVESLLRLPTGMEHQGSLPQLLHTTLKEYHTEDLLMYEEVTFDLGMNTKLAQWIRKVGCLGAKLAAQDFCCKIIFVTVHSEVTHSDYLFTGKNKGREDVATVIEDFMHYIFSPPLHKEGIGEPWLKVDLFQRPPQWQSSAPSNMGEAREFIGAESYLLGRQETRRTYKQRDPAHQVTMTLGITLFVEANRGSL
ncbi:hypothetical protein F5141DRAFT_1062853 [Pisolithus sp. B1]|nr:hypothetical protein F5141DRAFT_1062853 [Pisolithus sp. B1]